MRIAVLGGGNGSYAAAADLAEQGHEVRLWRRDAAAFAPVLEASALRLVDHRGSREVRLALATTALAAALAGAELIVAPVPAFGQVELARATAAHLADGQVIFLPPGSFGSYVMARVFREAGARAEVSLAETGTLPYLTRKRGAAEIAITTRATRLPTGVFPARLGAHAIAVIKRAYSAIEPVEDALSAALMNAGPIIHPPLIVMNAGPIEHFEHWDIHNEGTTPSIRRVTTALDGERMLLREALGYGPPHFPLADHYESDRWMYGNLAHDKLVESGDWRERLDLLRHRYMREDVAYGLAFLDSVAAWTGIGCPVARGLLAIAAAMCGEDFSRSPRRLEALGLDRLDRDAMARLLKEGLE
ncbi:MAG TPA: NAD/NADP octopine/nopaline dehydrogenase family protein [Stellaceae bacterium]|nr:NAD/NADP octopine/nopaline dehydrogenase family protein [Stellaceae bacterium]